MTFCLLIVYRQWKSGGSSQFIPRRDSQIRMPCASACLHLIRSDAAANFLCISVCAINNKNLLQEMRNTWFFRLTSMKSKKCSRGPRNKIIKKSLPCTKEDLRKSIDARVISRQSCDSSQTNDDFQDIILIQTDHKILSMEIIRTFRN